MPVSVLSGGERRRVALCKLLLEAPDLLLLDEPTNHLDAESVLWLEQFLQHYPGAVLAVTHDRYFLDNVAEWICEVDRGHLYPYKGNYSTYLETKAARLAAQGQRDAKLAKRMALRTRVGAIQPQGAPGEEQGTSSSATSRWRPRRARAQKLDCDGYPAFPCAAPGREGDSRPSTCTRRSASRVLIDDLSFSAAPGRASWA